MQTIAAFTEVYISPFFLAIGLAFFLNGLINYFIIGNIGLEEDRKEQGRQSLLWAASFFIVALLLFALTSWVASLGDKIRDRAKVEVDSGEDSLSVPNVPGYNR